MSVILKILKRYPLPKEKSDHAGTKWEALERHRLRIVKYFCSDIQDGHYGDHTEILQTTSPSHPQVSWTELKSWIELKTEVCGGGGEGGRAGATWRFRVANHSGPTTKMATVRILKIFKPYLICSRKVSRNESKLCGGHWGDVEIPDC